MEKFLYNLGNLFEDKKFIFLEILAFVLFITGTIFISFYHEPWFDEFQSLQIAKDNLYNIIFVIPHGEGHPALWHLILKFTGIFTKNPELNIKIPNLLFTYCGIWLLIFKSPFKRIVRIALPFTYFFFYQYAVISRPYCITILAMFLVAYLYKKKNDVPVKYTLSLLLLSMSSFYGMLFAFIIAVDWLRDIFKNGNVKSKQNLSKFIFLFLLLIINIFTFVNMWPENTISTSSTFININLFQKTLYFLCGLPADATATNICNYTTSNYNSILSVYFIIACCWGIVFSILFCQFINQNKNRLFYYILYWSFILSCLVIYASPHHIGILTLIIIFIFWQIYNTNSEVKINKYFAMVLTLSILVQLLWSVSAYKADYKSDYASSRNVADFIKERKLENHQIFSSWSLMAYPVEDKTKNKTYLSVISQTNIMALAVVVNAYYDKNIFSNFNVENHEPYVINHIRTDKEERERIRIWRKIGLPEYMFIGEYERNPKEVIEIVYSAIFPKEFSLKDYVVVKKFTSKMVFKYTQTKNELFLLKHKSVK